MLARVVQVPGFETALQDCLAGVGPITVQTDVDWLVLSMAPEVHRLVAAWRGLRGEFAAAADESGVAAALYQPMQPRFPELHSRALAEQALYLLRSGPEHAPRATALLLQAITALPQIQEQKYEEMVRPYAHRLAACLVLAPGPDAARAALRAMHVPEAGLDARLADAYVGLVEIYIRRPRPERPPVEDWLRSAQRLAPAHVGAWSWLAWLAAERGDAAEVEQRLRDAAKQGVAAEKIAQIRFSLRQEFPAIPHPTGTGPESPGALGTQPVRAGHPESGASTSTKPAGG
jgi:hypothetical protein